MRGMKKRPGDNVCDICGSIGYVENLVRCSQCKMASEHIYCMKTIGYVASKLWYCEVCTASRGTDHDGKLKSKQQNVDISDITGPQFKRTEFHDQDNFSFNKIQSAELDIDEMHQTGSRKLFPFEDGSLEMRHVGKGRVSAKYLSHNSSFNRKQPSKVKPLSAEEVVQLASGAVGRVCSSHRSLLSSPNQSNASNFTPSSSYKTNKSKPSSSRPEESFYQPLKIHFDSGVKLFPSKCITTRENDGEKVHAVIHDKQNIKESLSPGVLSPRCNTSLCSQSASTAPSHCKIDGIRRRQADNVLEATKEESLKKGDLIEVCSPSQHTKSTWPKCLNSQILHIGDKKRKTESGGEVIFAKPHEEDHFKNSHSVKSCVAEKVLVLHDTTINMSPSESGKISCSETQLKETGFQSKSLPLTSPVHPGEKISNYLTAQVRWKGTFEVLFLDSFVNFEMQAHCPKKFSLKVYDMSQQIPTELKLKVVPRTDVWPRAFQSDPPEDDDIGLYFLPSSLKRSKEDYFCFLERIVLGDFALKSRVGDVELLAFTSKQLPVDSQRIENEIYLWGVFRHVKRMKGTQHKDVPSNVLAVASQPSSSSQFNVPLVGNSKEVSTNIDMVGGTEIGSVDTSVQRLGVAPGFTRPISSDVTLNVPSVACQSQKKSQFNVSPEGDINKLNMKVDIVNRMKIGLVDRPIPRFDRPPGFRELVSRNETSNEPSFVSQANINSESNVSYESDVKELDKKVDIVKRIGISFADKSTSRLDVPLDFARPISSDLASNGPFVASQHNTNSQLNFPAESDIKKVDQKVDIWGGTEIGLVDIIPRLHTPPGFTRPISGDNTSNGPIVASMANTAMQLNFSPECSNSTEVDMEVDMVGGIEIGLSDKPIARVNSPPAFSRLISENVNHEERSLLKFTLKKVTREISPNPFFSRDALEQEDNLFAISHGVPISRTDHNSLVSLSTRDSNTTTSETWNALEYNQVSSIENMLHLEHNSSSPAKLSKAKNVVHVEDHISFKESDYVKVREAPHAELKSNYPSSELSALSVEKACSSVDHHIDENVVSSAKHKSASAPSLVKKRSHDLFERLNSENVSASPEVGVEVHHLDKQLTTVPANAKPQSSSKKSSWQGFAQYGGHESSSETKQVQGNDLANAGNSISKETEEKEEINDLANAGNSISQETEEKEEINDQTANYEGPLTSSEQPVLLGRRALPLFPVLPEFRSGNVIEDAMNEQDFELNIRRTNPQISPDLSLSRPHYVQDGNIWISAVAQEKLKKDRCGDSLRLSF
ncbi:hypothetical protein J5N97_010227 [Dioscorea zingiberensis]|uniref:Zinc finger PHD-type domain-containing protein n=1 Tax=Dioscorea zingiberensis TaxID=325984 RepID=A0A9D5D090_9LILI|nr:hypothetical protein J5N97_010227 [Dioscorea zingiberensis]